MLNIFKEVKFTYELSKALNHYVPLLKIYVYTELAINTNLNLVTSVVLITCITTQFSYYIYNYPISAKI